MAKSKEYQAQYSRRRQNARRFGLSMQSLAARSRRRQSRLVRRSTSSGTRTVIARG